MIDSWDLLAYFEEEECGKSLVTLFLTRDHDFCYGKVL